MQRRGLSDIITTVLIILLAIAAVVLIWGFIKKPIEQGGQQIQTSTDCMALKLTPTSCALITSADNTTLAAGIVRWAEGDVALKKIKLIIADKSGQNNIVEIGAPSSLLGTTSGNITFTGLDASSLSLSAVGEVQATDGSLVTCTASQQESIACSAA